MKLLSSHTRLALVVLLYLAPLATGCKCPSASSIVCDSSRTNCRCVNATRTFACDQTCCHRRRLKEVGHSGESFYGNEPEYFETVDVCGGFHYDAFVYVDVHFYAVASPKKDAIAAGCPYVVSHADFGEDNVAVKKLMVWTSKEEGEAIFGDEGSLHMGTFKLSELARAYEEADPGAAGAYDILTNSCADFVIDLGLKLGVKIDSRVTTFVARRLVELASDELFDRICKSLGYFSLFDENRNLRVDTVTDAEAIKLLVESHASRLY